MEPFEPPKYIASLIAAINDGAKSAQLGALAFTAIGVFLLATTFSATDEDLLLNHAVSISQLGGVSVPVAFAFGLAPTVFVGAHVYTLMRFDMLGGNLRRFNAELTAMVPLEADRERCRQLLANVEFVSARAMPPGSAGASWLFRAAVTALLVVFPVLVLLLVHIGVLRLQSEVVNWVHHAALAADLVLLVWYFFRQDGGRARDFRRAPWRRGLRLCWLPVLVMAMDKAWLNVPSPEAEATVRSDLLRYAHYDRDPDHDNLLDRWTRVLLALPVQPIDLVLCDYLKPGWGCRYLTLNKRPLVAKVWDNRTFVELRAGDGDEQHRKSIEVASLRNRSLRFAILTASELFGADLSGAQLQGANLIRAQLQGASLFQAQLQGADLSGAQLQGADLGGAQLQGADLSGAQLQGAYLGGAQLQGADLYGAQLQGADLGGAQLQGADLRLAQLQGASLIGAQLQGASLNKAQLQRADLSGAQLQGADLWQAQLQGTDLSEARLWNATSDAATDIGLANLSRTSIETPDLPAILRALPQGTPDRVRQRLSEVLALPAPASATAPLATASTKRGKVLLDKTCEGTDFLGVPCEHTTTDRAEFVREVIPLLVEAARVHTAAAERIAFRALVGALPGEPMRLLYVTLACRLLDETRTGSVLPEPGTIKRLKESAGAGCQLSAQDK